MTEEGWIKRCTVCEPRLSEFVKLYEALGFEVMLKKPSEDELRGACGKEFAEEEKKLYKTIYTRKKSDLRGENYEELL